MKALKRISEKQKRSLADLEEEYQRVAKEELAGQRVLLWTFLFPLDIEVRTSSSFTVLGVRFTLSPFDSVAASLRTAAISTLERRSPGAIPGAALVASSKSLSWQTAWQKIEPALDTLRGAVEFALGLGSWRMTTEPKPRRKVPHPPIMVVRGAGGALDSWRFFVDRPTDSQVYHLTDNQLKKVDKLAPIFRRQQSPNSSGRLIVNCLRLYAQAMDAEEHYACFMGLWQLAEAICLSESFGGETEKVVSRLSWHGEKLGLKGSGYSATLKLLARKRNDVVHRGLHRIEEQDVNILKLACEVALWWLIEERARIHSTLHLAQFYRYKDANEAELRALRRSSVYIERHRKKAG